VTGLRSAVDLVATSARFQMRIVRAHPLFLVGGVLHPAVLLLIMFFARGRPVGEQVTAIATAVLLMAYWGSTVWQGANILRRERSQGTLAPLMRGVRDPLLALFGMSLGASVAPALLTAATVAAVLWLADATVVVASPGWFAFGLVATILSGTALGTLLSSLFLLTRYGLHLSNALLYPVFLLAGLLIPVDFYPVAIRWLSWFISLRWAQQFLASTAHGDLDFPALALVGVLTLGYAVAGVVAFHRIDHLVRERGTLELG
jgi:ABC-2 type transport system permease protein